MYAGYKFWLTGANKSVRPIKILGYQSLMAFYCNIVVM